LRGPSAVVARAAIAVAALGFASSAPAASWVASPSVAIHNGRAIVAWTAGGVVQTSTQNADGSFLRGVAVGRAVGGTAPKLTVTPAGDQMIVWRSDHVQRVAFKRAGERAWTVTKTAAPNGYPERVAMDASGRAIAAWSAWPADPAAPEALFVSMRPAGGAWSAPVLFAGDVRDTIALGTDVAGDVVLGYGTLGGIVASVLPAGSVEWGAPVAISGADALRTQLEIVGGGARTFVARWSAINFQQPPAGQKWNPSIAREARVSLPGTWSGPQDVFPSSLFQDAPYAYGSSDATAVDAFGNATAVWQFYFRDPAYPDYALGVARLPAGEEAWTPPATLDLPAQSTWTDSVPGLAVDGDGSTTVAFIRGGRNDFHVVVASSQGPFAPLQGHNRRVADLPTRSPCKTQICARDWKVDPALAVGDGAAVIAVQSRKRAVVVLTRPTPDAPWSAPVTLRGAGRTTVYLWSRRVQNGAVPISASCALPPCRGVVELREAENGQFFGRLHFAFTRAGMTPGRIAVPAWAMARMRIGEHIRVKLTYDVREGDGTVEHLLLITRLHVRTGD
jgi:hypothetical protein